jgi:1-deoxy-D-xylulose-5-phosphate synthase
VLEAIHSPADLHRLNYAQLDELCQEIRQLLVEGVAHNGGHLSPNLGVVELTVALHRVFESPRDQIVWDVGHQAYVHKLLTGRAQLFDTLRQEGGISGYPSQAESEHDLVENSHASTSLSYALGLAEAKLRRGEEGHVVAVIGDGAMTGGMAYEALNQIAYHEPGNLLIVLNDNGRSYAPTVGGMARHLAQLRLDPRYDRLKSELDFRLKDLPGVGDGAHEAARRMKESVKQLLQPSNVFDALGLTYAGPADGHDLLELEWLLRRAKQRRTPTLVHVMTEKGRGYGPAIDDEIDKLHQVSPLSDPLTGRPRSTSLTYSDVAGAAVMDAAQRHPEVVAITAAMASSTGLLDFQREFPERFYDVGICEQHAVTFAAGLALGGFRPIVCVYSSFLQRGFDQMLMDVGLHHLPVVFLLDRAGVTGSDGASAQGTFDLSYLRMVPGLRIAAPADATELCALLETALTLDGPIAIRFPKGVAPATPDLPVEPLPVGHWDSVRQGGQAAILAVGRMVEVAAVASDLLREEGIECAVVNARWIKPLDARLPELAARYPVLVTAEDNVITGGFGAAVLEALAPHGLAGRVRLAALPDEYLAHASAADILAERGLDPEGLGRTVRESLRSLGDGVPRSLSGRPRRTGGH